MLKVDTEDRHKDEQRKNGSVRIANVFTNLQESQSFFYFSTKTRIKFEKSIITPGLLV
jgi:hypothetical protein